MKSNITLKIVALSLFCFLFINAVSYAPNDPSTDSWEDSGTTTFTNNDVYINSPDTIHGGLKVNSDNKIGFSNNGGSQIAYMAAGPMKNLFGNNPNTAYSRSLVFKTGNYAYNSEVFTRMIITGNMGSNGGVIMGHDVVEEDAFSTRLSVWGGNNTNYISGYSPAIGALGGFGMPILQPDGPSNTMGCWINTYNDANHNGITDEQEDRDLLGFANSLAFYVGKSVSNNSQINNSIPAMFINGLSGGYHKFVGIGTTNPQHRLHVEGTIAATGGLIDGLLRVEECIIEDVTIPDYVFTTDYDLPTIEEEAAFINENGHLIGYESAKIMGNKIILSDYTTRNHEKIEVLTLHTIELNEENKQLKSELESVRTEMAEMKKMIQELMQK